MDITKGSALAWSAATGDWRLVYESLSVGAVWDSPDVKPLIETPVRIRLIARDHLSKLVDQIAELIPKTEPETEKKKSTGLLGKLRAEAEDKAAEPEDLDAIFSSEDKIPF